MLRSSRLSLSCLTAVLGLANLSRCYTSDDGGSIIVGDVLFGDGPFDISNKTLLGLLEHPNVTGSVDWSVEANQTWTLNVSILADVPVKKEVTQVSVLSLEGHNDAVTSTVGDELTLCAAVWTGVRMNNKTAGKDSDPQGQCDNALSKSCQEAMRRAVSKELIDTGKCGVPSLLTECDDDLPESTQVTGFGMSPCRYVHPRILTV